MPKPTTPSPLRSYGRQNEGKTIKSFSLSADLAAWAEAEAASRGVSFSAFIESIIAQQKEPTNVFSFGLNETKPSEISAEPPTPPSKPVTYAKPKRPRAGGGGSGFRHAAEEHHKDEGHDGL